MATIQPLNTKGEFPLVHKANAPSRVSLRLGNGTALEIVTAEIRSDQESSDRSVFVSIFTAGRIRFGSYAFNSWAQAYYVQEKLGLGPSDAANMADFINWQLKHRNIIDDKVIDTQGSYQPSICADYPK